MSSSRFPSAASSRSRLHATMENLAEKRQREFEETSKWNTQKKYYKNWDRHNSMYQNWTSPEYYTTSTTQYDCLKTEEKKKKSLEERRQKLQLLLFQENQEYETELTLSPRDRFRTVGTKLNETPIEVLKEVNVGIKLADDDRRRHEAELKLYHKWKSDNPIIRDFETNQNKSGLKLAWLDQQIEKRMEQEKTEEEIRVMIKKRDAAIKQQEHFERIESQEMAQKEKQMMEEIEEKMQEFKLKGLEANQLKNDEDTTLQKRNLLQDMLTNRNEDLKIRKQQEIALFNIKQSKLKLRKRATDVQQQLQLDRKRIEDLLQSQTIEEIKNFEKKHELKTEMYSFLKHVREQQDVEEKRQSYIQSIFDSEARNLWDKQERLWKSEQETREKLFQDVLSGIKEQIEEKIIRNLDAQKHVLHEREEMLRTIEDQDIQMKSCFEEMQQKKFERKLELDKQIQDKSLDEKRKQFEEERKRNEELENIKKEETKIKQELLKMQRRHYPQQNGFNRRIMW